VVAGRRVAFPIRRTPSETIETREGQNMRGTALLGAATLVGLMTTSFVGASVARAEFTVTSPDLSEGGTFKEELVSNVFGCKGGNMVPALAWSGAPAGTKSFAITMYDPDAPTGSGFWHWAVVNIPAKVTGIKMEPGGPKTKVPKGAVQVRNDYGFWGYGGPCPPTGDKPHRYALTVYAVDLDRIDAGHETSAAVIGFNLHFHTLAKATINATYGR
jgi:Raf kinase inhibitor-like YbhB/YbcL family protein